MTGEGVRVSGDTGWCEGVVTWEGVRVSGETGEGVRVHERMAMQ